MSGMSLQSHCLVPSQFALSLLPSPSWPMAGLVDVSDVDVNSRFPSFSRGRDAAAYEGITL